METIKAAFRTQMGGYNKQDVNNYIAGLCERFESEKKALEARCAALSEELSRYRADESAEKRQSPKAELAAILENSGANTANQAMPNQAPSDKPSAAANADGMSAAQEQSQPSDAAQAENKAADPDRERLRELLAQTEAVVSAQRTKIESLNRTVSEKDNEISDLNTRLEEANLEAEAAKEKLADLSDAEKKLADYDRMSAKLGSLMIKAEADADSIREAARAEAEEKLKKASETEKSLAEREDALRRSLDERYAAAVDAVNRKLSALTEEGLASIKAAFTGACGEIESVIEKSRAEAEKTIKLADDAIPEIETLARIDK